MPTRPIRQQILTLRQIGHSDSEQIIWQILM